MAQQNKKLDQTKIPGNADPEDDSKKRPKFNKYWIYGLLLVIIIGFNWFRGANSGGAETNVENFKQMVKQGDVEGIKIIRNKKLVRVFVKKDSISTKSGFYKSIIAKPKDYQDLASAENPQIFFTIGDEKSFSEQMENFRKENPSIKNYSTRYYEEGGLFGQIISTLLPILLIGLLFIFIMMIGKVGRFRQKV